MQMMGRRRGLAGVLAVMSSALARPPTRRVIGVGEGEKLTLFPGRDILDQLDQAPHKALHNLNSAAFKCDGAVST